VRFPSDTHRHAIVGATGSGKTQAALWHLSHRNFHTMPWVVYNFKTDESIDGIPGATFIELEDIPIKPGVYITHPEPDQETEVEEHMREIWRRQNIGVYVDEGYMVGRGNMAFRSLLTQGRSRRIPMMVLSQRPVWMDRFVFSESEFFQVFRLQHSDDNKNMAKIVPANFDQRLPEFHSWYYDVGENKVYKMAPVPDIDTIHRTFRLRLEKLKKVV
jgi:hypothetical protein